MRKIEKGVSAERVDEARCDRAGEEYLHGEVELQRDEGKERDRVGYRERDGQVAGTCQIDPQHEGITRRGGSGRRGKTERWLIGRGCCPRPAEVGRGKA